MYLGNYELFKNAILQKNHLKWLINLYVNAKKQSSYDV